MRIAFSFALLALVVSASVVASSGPGAVPEARVIQIEVGDNMRFAPAAITAERGDYMFVCTFPGHFAVGMKGILTAK